VVLLLFLRSVSASQLLRWLLAGLRRLTRRFGVTQEEKKGRRSESSSGKRAQMLLPVVIAGSTRHQGLRKRPTVKSFVKKRRGTVTGETEKGGGNAWAVPRSVGLFGGPESSIWNLMKGAHPRP
jgi:hypothetical protein